MNKKRALPLMLAIAMALGFWLGSGLEHPFGEEEPSRGWQKIEEILRYVEHDYVDTVSRKKLEDEVVAYLLQRLDPHSHYIEEHRLQAFNEPLEGGFEGIGVQFSIRHDTVYIINTIPRGPAERAGVRPSDRILAVEGEQIAGNGVTNEKVMKLLKGAAGSEVSITVKREGTPGLLDVTIQRGEVPLTSIDAVYMLDSATLYVRLARFAKTTVAEFEERVVPFAGRGIKYMVLDLRGNGGGFLDAAIQVADEFLAAGRLITYTEGKARPRQDYRASGGGSFEQTVLCVLIDHYSASASEILAGAVQDHQRGVIIGKRSYGKGLVQEQNEWPDGSATRLTVARYFTPNGRSIQKPYETMPEAQGAYHGFATEPETTAQGGILPDVEVASDTSSVSWLYAEVVHRGLLNDFTYDFRDLHLGALMTMEERDFLRDFAIDSLKSAMQTYLENHGVVIDEKDWAKSSDHMAARVKALLGRSLYGEGIYFQIINAYDPFVQAALREIKNPGQRASRIP